MRAVRLRPLVRERLATLKCMLKENNKRYAKAYEISFNTTIDNSGTNIVDTCAIAQGTAFNQRVGLQIQPLVLDIQCNALANASTVASTAFRMLVVQSMGSEVSTPAIDEIINNVAGQLHTRRCLEVVSVSTTIEGIEATSR